VSSSREQHQQKDTQYSLVVFFFFFFRKKERKKEGGFKGESLLRVINGKSLFLFGLLFRPFLKGSKSAQNFMCVSFLGFHVERERERERERESSSLGW
jgi:hypothetical protein